MPTSNSRHTENQASHKRNYQGEMTASFLVRMLNDEQESPDYALLEEAVTACKRLDELAKDSSLSEGEWDGFVMYADLEFRERYQTKEPNKPGFVEILQLQGRLKEILSDYKCVPQIDIMMGDLKDRRVGRRWVLSPDSSFAKRNPNRQGDHPIVFLLAAIEDDSLSKVSKCTCGKWYFRKFDHQKYCSENCRIKENQSSEKAREYRRRKQREYYHLHKSGKVKD